MQWLLMPIAIGAGMLMVVQSACNSMLEKVLDRPVLVGIVSLSVGVGVLLSIGIAVGHLTVSESQTARVPWWAWLGGACGAIALLSQPLVAPKLGAGTYIGLFVTASTIVSVLFDHFGWMGFDEHPAGIGRIVGCVLMILGISLVSFF
jgi:bacterial/archaeal transporter family-2 protein